MYTLSYSFPVAAEGRLSRALGYAFLYSAAVPGKHVTSGSHTQGWPEAEEHQMTDDEYLQKVLEEQTLAKDSDEMAKLEQHRKDVEALLKKEFGSGPKLREGGSKAKGTMVKEAYDLDLPYYFARDDESAGKTIREIFERVETALQRSYRTRRKGVAVRLLDCEQGTDFHVDVAPGRYVDGDDGDAFLYPSTSDKERLQTNLETHVRHVRDSGSTGAVRLLKIWRARRNIEVKTFALELLTIDILVDKKKLALPDQLKAVWTEFRDNLQNRTITDPANSNNDLSEMLNSGVRQQLRDAARDTLRTIEQAGWKAVFGELEEEKKAARAEALRRVALSSPSPARPWCRGS